MRILFAVQLRAELRIDAADSPTRCLECAVLDGGGPPGRLGCLRGLTQGFVRLGGRRPGLFSVSPSGEKGTTEGFNPRTEAEVRDQWVGWADG